MKHLARTLLPAFLILAGLLYSGTAVLSVRAAPIEDPVLKPLTQVVATPIPTPQTNDGDEENDNEPAGETIFQTIIQTIFFPFETLAEGVRSALAELFSQTVEAALAPMKEALNSAVSWLYPQDMLRDIRWKAWRAMVNVAAALMPLALVITVGSAMKEGVTSITGYANAREALLNWLIGVGAAAASFFLIEKGIDLSGAAASAVRASMGQTIAEEWDLGEQLLGTIVNVGILQSTGPLMQLFLGFFALFTMIAVVSSIILALLSREVILLLLVAVSPIIFVMGSLRPLRWLSGLWTKAMVLALLLVPMNYMLLTIAVLVSAKANAYSTGLAGTILGMLVGIGVISVMVGLNGVFGKMVYGAAMEIAQKAWGSTLGVLQLAAVAAGFVLAPAAAGLISGGAGTATGGIGLKSSATGSVSAVSPSGAEPAGVVGGFNAARDVSTAAGAFGRSTTVSNMTTAIGRAMSHSRNPFVRGFGQGIGFGNAANALDGNLPRISSQPVNEPVDVKAGLSAANEELMNRFAANEPVAMAKFGLPEPQAKGLIGEGVQVSKNAFAAMDNLGLDQGTALRDLGYYQGRNMTGAVANFGRVTAGQWALRSRSPYSSPTPIVPPGPNLGGHDIQAALDIVNGPARADGSIVASPTMLGQLAVTVHQRRVQRGESLRSIVDEATRYKTSGELSSWMHDSYYNLPNRELARDLRDDLGIVPPDDDQGGFA